MKKCEDFSVRGPLKIHYSNSGSKGVQKKKKKLIPLGLSQIGNFIAFLPFHCSPNQQEGQSPSTSFNLRRQIKYVGNTLLRRISHLEDKEEPSSI